MERSVTLLLILHVKICTTIQKPPTLIDYWTEKLNLNLDIEWDKVSVIPRRVKIEKKMRIFQYKILNNALHLNKKLCKMGLVETPLCSFCKENDKTLIHLFVWCPVTKNLWNRFKEWLSVAINLPEVSLQNALLGVITETGSDSNMSNILINHLMLIFKKTMYDMRTSTFPLSIYVLEKKVAKTMKIDMQLPGTKQARLSFEKVGATQRITRSSHF